MSSSSEPPLTTIFKLQQEYGLELIAKTDAMFQGENLVQVILHDHLIVEQIPYQKIIKAVRNPTYIDESFNFARKIKLYCALYDATEQLRKSLYELKYSSEQNCAQSSQ